MEEAGAVWSRGRGNGGRSDCRRPGGEVRGVFSFSGQDYGSLTQGWRERKIGAPDREMIGRKKSGRKKMEME